MNKSFESQKSYHLVQNREMLATLFILVHVRNELKCKWESLPYVALINLFQSIAAFYIETSHLFSSAKQMTCFYMKCNTELKWINSVQTDENGTMYI